MCHWQDSSGEEQLTLSQFQLTMNVLHLNGIHVLRLHYKALKLKILTWLYLRKIWHVSNLGLQMKVTLVGFGRGKKCNWAAQAVIGGGKMIQNTSHLSKKKKKMMICFTFACCLIKRQYLKTTPCSLLSIVSAGWFTFDACAVDTKIAHHSAWQSSMLQTQKTHLSY